MWLGEAADRRRIGDPPGAPAARMPAMGRAGCQGRGRAALRITNELRLPAFRYFGLDPYAWP